MCRRLSFVLAIAIAMSIFSAARAQTIEGPREKNTAAAAPSQQQQTISNSPRVIRPPHTQPIQSVNPSEFVDVHSIDPSIVIDLRYATEHNVTGHQLYPNGMHALVLPRVAQQLAGAEAYLKQFRYRLKIWDAYRPKEAQELLWKYASKDQFVANPEKGFGSMHSYGVSVDATLVDDWSQDAAMPTRFDEFTPQAMMHYTGRDPLVKEHLTLLQKAMSHNNFYGLRVEWWHFTTADWKNYIPWWKDPQMSQAGETPSPKS